MRTAVAGPSRPVPAAGHAGHAGHAGSRAARRGAILDIVEAREVGSQGELAGLLRDRGFAATQATVSRDIAELGLLKATRGDHHAYVTPAALADPGLARPERDRGGAVGPRSLGHAPEARLRRILADYPVRVGRSGLSLVLVSTPGAASVIAQALDEVPLGDEVGTLAGDNTLLVLFATDADLERWRTRFEAIAARASDSSTEPAGPVSAGRPDLTSTYP